MKVEWAETHVSVEIRLIRVIRVIRVLFKLNKEFSNRWLMALFNMKRNGRILKYNL
jgi:hypothetical protein